MASIIEKGFIHDNQLYKTKKINSDEINLLEPFVNISLTGECIPGDSNKIGVIINDDFVVPIERGKFFQFLSTVTAEKGIIKEACCILSESNGFSLARVDSTEYISAYLKYETEKQEKIVGFSEKDIACGDKISFLKGKEKKSDYIYFGSFFTLPCYTNKRYASQVFVQADNKVSKRFIFGKFKENTADIEGLFVLSSFPIVTEKESSDIFWRIDLNSSAKRINFLEKILLGQICGMALRPYELLLKDSMIAAQYIYIPDKFFGMKYDSYFKLYENNVSKEKALNDLSNIVIPKVTE